MSANEFYGNGSNERYSPANQQSQQNYDPNIPQDGDRGILGATVGGVGGAIATYKYTNGSVWKAAAGAIAGGIALSKIEDGWKESKQHKQNQAQYGGGYSKGVDDYGSRGVEDYSPNAQDSYPAPLPPQGNYNPGYGGPSDYGPPGGYNGGYGGPPPPLQQNFYPGQQGPGPYGNPSGYNNW